MFKNLKVTIKIKLITAMLIVGLLPVLVVGFVSLQTSRVELEKEVINHLESVAQSRASHIETFIDNKKVLAQELALIGKVEKVLLDPSDANVLAVNERLQNTVDSVEGIIYISVVDKSGIVIAETNPILIGEDRGEISLFTKVSQGGTVIAQVKLPPEGGSPVLSIASPVKSGDEIIGFVFVRTNLDSLNKITTDSTGLRETGETYLLNKEGYMITPSRFKEDIVLKQKVDTVNAENCLSGLEHSEEGEDAHAEHEGHKAVEVFQDYRGVNVLGTHVYIPEMQWCLLAEMDEAGAMAGVNETRSRILLISGLFAIFALLAALIFSNRISKPIKKLRDITVKIGKGNLDIKSDIKSKDEIGDLARDINLMAENLKEYQDKLLESEETKGKVLEKEVKEKTKQLREQVKELNDTKVGLLNMMDDLMSAGGEIKNLKD